MHLDLTHIFKSEGAQLKFDCIVDLKELELFDVKPFIGSAQVRISAYNVGGIVKLHLDISSPYRIECDRCTAFSDKVLDISMDMDLVRFLNDETPEDATVLKNALLDIDEIVEQSVIINFPMKHLCSENCKGLCVSCGKDLNLDSCKCGEKGVDPRLAVLEKLLEK